MGKTKDILLFIALALCWGPSYLFIKIAVQELGPITIAASRLLIGAVFLFVIILLRRRNLWKYRHMWMHFLFMGIFLNAFPFSMINYGEQYVSSGLAAIVIAMNPIFTAIIVRFTSSEPFSLRKLFGISIAFLGIILIYYRSFFDQNVGNEVGVIMITIAALSYAVSTVYARKFLHGMPPLVAPTAQLILSSIILIPLSFIFEHPHIPSSEALGAVIALGILGTGLAFFIFYELLRRKGAVYVSLNALVSPIIAVILGWIILGEQLSWNSYLGGFIVIAGLAIMNPLIGRMFSFRHKSD